MVRTWVSKEREKSISLTIAVTTLTLLLSSAPGTSLGCLGPVAKSPLAVAFSGYGANRLSGRRCSVIALASRIMMRPTST